MITIDLIKEYFHYENGIIYHKKIDGKSHQFRVNTEAGAVSGNGYRHVRLKNKTYLAHRIIFFMHHGYFPKEIDHINKNTLDNRIENLREVTRTQNNLNQNLRKDNSSGHSGIYFSKQFNTYHARVWVNGKNVWGKYFRELDDAVAARNACMEKIHGEFGVEKT